MELNITCDVLKVGDEVVISTTSYDPWQTEKRTISAISDDLMTLTLSEPLEHAHLGQSTVYLHTAS